MNTHFFTNLANTATHNPRDGLIMMVVAILVFIFREPYYRYCAKWQNETWGTHYHEKKGIWTLYLWCSVLFVLGVKLALNISLDFSITERIQNFIFVILSIIVGLFMIFYKQKDGQSIIHFKGKPAVFHVGKRKIYLHRMLAVLFGIVGVVGGVMVFFQAI